jgi:hypothetical protein
MLKDQYVIDVTCYKHHFSEFCFLDWFHIVTALIVTIIVFTSRHQPGLVALLHSCTPCSSCGIRFLPEETMKYRQHLNWHFCQNSLQKDSGHKQSRGWFYSLSDWMQCEESDDPEERGMICISYLDITLRTA